MLNYINYNYIKHNDSKEDRWHQNIHHGLCVESACYMLKYDSYIEHIHELAFNSELRKKGKMWFDSGLKLEIAPKCYRENEHFIRGYEIGYLKSMENDKQNKIKKRGI